jgi:transposase
LVGAVNTWQETIRYSETSAKFVREIARVLDLTWVRAELASYDSPLDRPSIDPVLMIRMLIVGYVFAVRSERLLCREVQVN